MGASLLALPASPTVMAIDGAIAALHLYVSAVAACAPALLADFIVAGFALGVVLEKIPLPWAPDPKS